MASMSNLEWLLISVTSLDPSWKWRGAVRRNEERTEDPTQPFSKRCETVDYWEAFAEFSEPWAMWDDEICIWP